jgi:hypothetical protein
MLASFASRHGIYRSFLEYVGTDIQSERRKVNRRMFGVFLWCFVIPAVVSLVLLTLVRLNILPSSLKIYRDRFILVFPVLYSLYILGSEVIRGVPSIFRKGGVATTLFQSVKEGEWRDRVSTEMSQKINATADDWRWVAASFQMDLQTLQERNRFLTALAGAVFYLLMQGIDVLGNSESGSVFSRGGLFALESISNDFSQIVALILFLVLLYLSGNQTYRALVRYLHSAKLVAMTARDAEE